MFIEQQSLIYALSCLLESLFMFAQVGEGANGEEKDCAISVD